MSKQHSIFPIEKKKQNANSRAHQQTRHCFPVVLTVTNADDETFRFVEPEANIAPEFSCFASRALENAASAHARARKSGVSLNETYVLFDTAFSTVLFSWKSRLVMAPTFLLDGDVSWDSIN